jgi:hypothetical protein
MFEIWEDVTDGGISIGPESGDPSLPNSFDIVSELTEVRYIMRPCQSNSDFKAGNFSYQHL